MTGRAAGARTALVQGVLQDHRPGVRFVGSINLQARDEGVYYTWRLESEDGEFLASTGQVVSYRVIPLGQDPFEFALSHALEGIRRYRINRVRPFRVEASQWGPA